MKLTFTNGEEASYIPLRLREGQESAELEFIAYPEMGDKLYTGGGAIITLWGKIEAEGEYQNLAEDPLELSAYTGEGVTVFIKATAAEVSPGVNRVYEFLGASSGGAAGWYN